MGSVGARRQSSWYSRRPTKTNVTSVTPDADFNRYDQLCRPATTTRRRPTTEPSLSFASEAATRPSSLGSFAKIPGLYSLTVRNDAVSTRSTWPLLATHAEPVCLRDQPAGAVN